MRNLNNEIVFSKELKRKIDAFMKQKSDMGTEQVFDALQNLEPEIKQFFDYVYSCFKGSSLDDKVLLSGYEIRKLKFGQNFNELFIDYLNVVLGVDVVEQEISDDEVFSRYNDKNYDLDLIKQYFLEIGKIPMLSINEEKRLANAYRNGDKEAGQILITSNLRLVVSIAKKYVGRGLSFMDLIQEGNESLAENAIRFDPDKGAKFGTYMTWWIRQGITRALANQGRSVRLPVHRIELINKVRFEKEQFFIENCREATAAELGDLLNIPEKKIRELLLDSERIISLDTPVNDDEDTTYSDFLEDEKILTPEKSFDTEDLRTTFDEILSGFSDRDRLVIKLRFGLEDGKAWTLEAVGQKYDVTRERIRQIEAKVMRKLRHPKYTDKLIPFLYRDYGEEETKKLIR